MADPEMDRTALLAVVVGSAAGRMAELPASDASEIRLVRAILSASGATEVAARPTATVLAFERWSVAVQAAVALRSVLGRLPPEFAGISVRLALELVPAGAGRTAADAIVDLARGAAPGEIRLGVHLAREFDAGGWDGQVIVPVDGATTRGRSVHVLRPAREVVPHNLEVSPTSFVGREAELEEIGRLLGMSRLVTITGPPGTGKTRLAGELAGRNLGRYAGGAWFVSLAPVVDPMLVMGTLAAAMGITVPVGMLPIAAIAERVKGRSTLVVLDNLEHLLSVRTDVADLLLRAAEIQLLVTSQIHLDLPGERALALAPLEVQSVADGVSAVTPAAVTLFVERASAAQPAFRLDPDARVLVAEICRRLDGLPLAIELTAAQLRLLPLVAIAEGVGSEPVDPRAAPGASGRHRTLPAAIEWSQALLDESTRALFRRLSVFRGGWTMPAAVAVAGAGGGVGSAVASGLAGLMDASLVNQVPAGPGSVRFTMLETLRQFGAERLRQEGAAAEAESRHARYYLDLATKLGPNLTGPGQARALDSLAEELDNIRAAQVWLLERDPVAALRLTTAIWRFWQMRGHLAEGSHAVSVALAAAEGQTSPGQEADARAAAGGLAYWRGDLAETQRQYERTVALRRDLGDERKLADALFDLAFVFDPALHPPPEDPDRTRHGIAIAEEAHAIYVAVGDEPGIAKSEWLLGSITAATDIERARTLLASSVNRSRTLGDPFGLGWGLHSYGLTLLRSSDTSAAAAAFGEALTLFVGAGDVSATTLLLDDFVEVAKTNGDRLRAATLAGAASGLRKATESELAVANAPWLFDAPEPRGLIDAAALESAWTQGRAMTSAEAVAYALDADGQPAGQGGLRVSALGPLTVERAGVTVSDWGGPKAGNRHALALFAFLMDRGPRGVTKDEFVEVLWPDATLKQGDLNFHRTLGGLRGTLGRGSGRAPAHEVVFANGRYRLASAVVAWLDADEFEQRLLHAVEATDGMAAIRSLEAARQLYRGDYLDDAPLYGDSSFVEERRTVLRGRLVDALLDLGRRYEARDDASLASARFREALDAAMGDCPSAADALQRLGSGSGSF